MKHWIQIQDDGDVGGDDAYTIMGMLFMIVTVEIIMTFVMDMMDIMELMLMMVKV